MGTIAIFVIAGIFLMGTVSTAQYAFAAPVYGTSADMTGIRCFAPVPSAMDPSVCNNVGLSVDPPDTLPGSGWADATLEWDISCGGGMCNYKYTLTGFDMGAVSHFVVDISEDLDCDDITDVKINGNDPADGFECKSQDGLDNSLKIDDGFDGVLDYTFKTNRLPVWHDVAIKDGVGQAEFAHNIGNADHDSEDTIDFIAAPNSESVPPVILVAGSLTPIDTTMVLVAGTQSIASWMIPVIVAGIGIGIVVARKF